MMTIRVGILGAARIAPKAVIVAARNYPEFQIVAVGARDKDRARAYAAQNNIPQVVDGYSQLVSSPDIDLVYNALPPAGHLAWTLEAVRNGKAVLCEKPFSVTAAEARSMVAAAEAAKQPLIEAFHYRFHKVMRRAAEIVASGELGALTEAESVFDAPIPYRENELRWIVSQGGGALMDLGCYCVHGLRTLAGCEPKVTRAECAVERGVDTATAAEFAFPNGLKAKLSTTMKTDTFVASMRLKGEKGSLHISNFLAPQMGCTFTVQTGGRTRNEPVDGPTSYECQLEHVADVLLRRVRPLTGGRDAIANMECIEAIYAAAGFKRALEG